MASPKPLATALSILLVVGIAIGLIVGVRMVNNVEEYDSIDLSSASKVVRAFCGPTDYKKACVRSLSGLDRNESATPMDYLRVSICAAINAVNATIDKSGFLSKETKDPEEKDALVDCTTLLGFAIDELQKALSSVGKVSMNKITSKEDDLKNWLSATISYQQSCLDIVESPQKEEMTHGMKDATELTSNALAMVSDFKGIFKSLGLDSNQNRRLLSDIRPNGYPRWLSAKDTRPTGKANVVVARDGSGQFKTINEAISTYPKGFEGRYVIYVKAGLYKEQVTIGKDVKNVFMYGDGPRRTIVTGRLNNAEGTNTWRSATFSAIGNGFVCKSMGFQNTAGPKGHQAVALRVQSDQSAFYNCRIDGYQGSLYSQAHRQFYRNCVISGTVDFIFGDSSTLIQNSLIIVRRPMDGQQNTVTAQGKSDARESTGIVIHNCKIVPDEMLFPDRFKTPSFLGRPWKQYSTTVIMESTIAEFIYPAGWVRWAANSALDKLYYAEYSNRGPGASTAQRVNWKGYRIIKDRKEAMKWTVGPFLKGQSWIPPTSTPSILGLES